MSITPLIRAINTTLKQPNAKPPLLCRQTSSAHLLYSDHVMLARIPPHLTVSLSGSLTTQIAITDDATYTARMHDGHLLLGPSHQDLNTQWRAWEALPRTDLIRTPWIHDTLSIQARLFVDAENRATYLNDTVLTRIIETWSAEDLSYTLVHDERLAVIRAATRTLTSRTTISEGEVVAYIASVSYPGQQDLRAEAHYPDAVWTHRTSL